MNESGSTELNVSEVIAQEFVVREKYRISNFDKVLYAFRIDSNDITGLNTKLCRAYSSNTIASRIGDSCVLNISMPNAGDFVASEGDWIRCDSPRGDPVVKDSWLREYYIATDDIPFCVPMLTFDDPRDKPGIVKYGLYCVAFTSSIDTLCAIEIASVVPRVEIICEGDDLRIIDSVGNREIWDCNSHGWCILSHDMKYVIREHGDEMIDSMRAIELLSRED